VTISELLQLCLEREGERSNRTPVCDDDDLTGDFVMSKSLGLMATASVDITRSVKISERLWLFPAIFS
jgi:hypothetical protein